VHLPEMLDGQFDPLVYTALASRAPAQQINNKA
jgi:hypothetical protein